MKTVAVAIALMVSGLLVNAQLATNQPARFQSKVEWSEKGNPGVSGDNIDPEFVSVGDTGTDTCTSPGHEYELKWTFVGRNQDYDVYQFTFTRMTKAGDALQTAASKEVQFDGKRIVIFDDDLHLVVMESPNKNELNTTQGTN